MEIVKNKSFHLAFLKERLASVKRRLTASPDYQETLVLERMIAELDPVVYLPTGKAQLRRTDGFGEWVEPEGAKQKNPASGFDKDMENSPAKKFAFGQRVDHVYELCEKAAQENNGEVELSVLVDHLNEIHNLDWQDVKTSQGVNQSKTSRLATYISLYNRTHPQNVTLALAPQREEGKKRALRYTKIIYIGRQRVVAI